MAKSDGGRGKRVVATAALLAGGAVAYVAAASTVAWGMILGSGVDLGGDAGQRWLMNLTEGFVAIGVIAGGRMIDAGRLGRIVGIAVICLTLGVLVAWRAPDSPGAVIAGLGLVASFGAGLMMALSVTVVATRAVGFAGIHLSVALCAGLVLVEIIWGSASMLSLSRGAAWVLGQVAWIGPLCAAAGGALLVTADVVFRKETRSGGEKRRLPLWGPGAEPRGERAADSGSFVILATLALATSFVAIMSQRAGAALSLMGLPEGSFASGVLVGFTFAVARAGGALAGGLIHDVVGPRAAVVVAGCGLAATTSLLSFFTGYENPWHALIGSIGVSCGVAFVVVPAACSHLLGRDRFGYHFGFLYLATALGNVLVLPLRPTVEAHPQAALVVVGVLCVAIGGAGRWLGTPRRRVKGPNGSTGRGLP